MIYMVQGLGLMIPGLRVRGVRFPERSDHQLCVEKVSDNLDKHA